MSDLAPYPTPRDRTAGLVVIGILEICLALLCLLMFAFIEMATLSLRSLPEGQEAAMSSRTMLGAGLFYLLGAAYFGSLGAGTLRARRWARTIGLVTSWMWLLSGIFGILMMVFILPKMMASMSAAAGPGNEGVGAVMTGCVFFFLILIYLGLPGILVLFYRGPNVRATFAARDPSLPWTDRVPAPVLALTLLLAFAAMTALPALFYGVLPVFGAILTGASAILGFLILAALCAALAWGVYHRRLAAWWAVVACWVLGCANGAFFLAQGSAGIRRLYGAMKMPAAQLEQIDRMGLYDMYSNPALLALMAVLWLGWLGFLIWTRRFFVEAREAV
jgi:hypothetical protein